MFSELRPVGNPVNLKSMPLNNRAFGPFDYIGCESGTAALALALIAVSKSFSDIEAPEVLIPAYTCPDIISACLYAKVRPVLVDFDVAQPCMDIGDLMGKIGFNTVAIIAINFMGIPEKVERIKAAIAERSENKNILVIEDSAQGFPISEPQDYWKGDLVITSFGRGKPVNLLGGGAVFYNKETLDQDIINTLKQFFVNGNTEQTFEDLQPSLTYKIKAMVFNLISQPFFYYILLRIPSLNIGATIFHPLQELNPIGGHFAHYFETNYQNYMTNSLPVARYNQLFKELNIEQIVSLPLFCVLPEKLPLLRYPVLIKDPALRERVFERLDKEGLGVSKMYQKCLPEIQGVEKTMYQLDGELVNASNFASQLITLPTHSGVTDRHIEKIEDIFRNVLNM